MIADPERGSSWTYAFLGIRAKVIHLCGDERSIELIQKLARQTNDRLYFCEYKRLNKLLVS